MHVKQTTKTTLMLSGFFVLAVVANEAAAATLSNAFTVCAAVTENCTISTDPDRLAAEYPPLVGPQSAATDSRSVAVRCTTGTDPEISVARVQTEMGARGSRRTIVATVTF